jgi:RNA recognition motif-containing protein
MRHKWLLHCLIALTWNCYKLSGYLMSPRLFSLQYTPRIYQRRLLLSQTTEQVLDDKVEEEENTTKLFNKQASAATPAARNPQQPEYTTPKSNDNNDDNATKSSGVGSKIYLKGLPWKASESEIRDFFKDCGTIVSCELPIDAIGRPSGTAYINFASRSDLTAALALNGTTWPNTNRWLEIIEVAGERPEGCDTVFVGNLPWNVTEQQMRTIFGELGEVVSVHLENIRAGFAHVQFRTGNDTEKAVQLAGTDINGRALQVNYAFLRKRKRKRKSFGVELSTSRNNKKEEFAGGVSSSLSESEYVSISAGRKAHKIYVKGLPWKASESEIRDFFKDCGTIVSCELPIDAIGRPSGTAYISFASRSDLTVLWL